MVFQLCQKLLSGYGGPLQSLPALATFNGHSGVVEDVAWHCRHANLFGSCGDDKKLIIWDSRTSVPQKTTEAHTAEVNCVAFNPMEEWLLATGSADRTVVLHDIRMLHQRLHVMDAHREEVFQACHFLVEVDIHWLSVGFLLLISCKHKHGLTDTLVTLQNPR